MCSTFAKYFKFNGFIIICKLEHYSFFLPILDKGVNVPIRPYLSTIPTLNSHFNSHLNSHFLLSKSGNYFLKNSHFSKKNSHFYLIKSGNLSGNLKGVPYLTFILLLVNVTIIQTFRP